MELLYNNENAARIKDAIKRLGEIIFFQEFESLMKYGVKVSITEISPFIRRDVIFEIDKKHNELYYDDNLYTGENLKENTLIRLLRNGKNLK